jgi:hypothetical protein
MQCTNNLKQFGIGMHNYHDTLKSLPPGNLQITDLSVPQINDAYGSTNAAYGTKTIGGVSVKEYSCMLGWPVFVLPFIEAQTVWTKVNFTKPSYTPVTTTDVAATFGDTANEDASKSAPSVFVCPSSQSKSIFPLGTFKDYSANADGVPPTQAVTAALTNPERYTQAETTRKLNGLFNKGSHYDLSAITDGTSNTIMVLERTAATKTVWSPGTESPEGKCLNPFFTVTHRAEGYVVTHAATPSDCFINPGRTTSLSSGMLTKSAQSDHPGGIQIGLADGSCRFLAQTISMPLYDALMTRRGGETAAAP